MDTRLRREVVGPMTARGLAACEEKDVPVLVMLEDGAIVRAGGARGFGDSGLRER